MQQDESHLAGLFIWRLAVQRTTLEIRLLVYNHQRTDKAWEMKGCVQESLKNMIVGSNCEDTEGCWPQSQKAMYSMREGSRSGVKESTRNPCTA